MLAKVLAGTTRAVCGVVPQFRAPIDFSAQKIYFGNHSSHLDFLVIWSSLPSDARAKCRPVAALDYWGKGFKKKLADGVFNAILVSRDPQPGEVHPIELMQQAVTSGSSLIIFPEGTRSMDGEIKPFKSGLYYLAKHAPQVELVPILLDNLNRILPKGEFLPVPIVAAVKFGEPIKLSDGEPKEDFLTRARDKLMELKDVR